MRSSLHALLVQRFVLPLLEQFPEMSDLCYRNQGCGLSSLFSFKPSFQLVRGSLGFSSFSGVEKEAEAI